MASASNADAKKPLPPIPLSNSLVHPQVLTLTISARAHRRKFIQQLLAEDGKGLLSHRQMAVWTDSLEAALDDLGSSVATGGWLAGLKRNRKLRKAERDARASEAEANAIELEKEREVSKTKAKASDVLPQTGPPTKEETISEALRQIYGITGHQILNTPRPSPKHLLLCLGDALHDSGSGLSLCTFTPGIFSLPETVLDIKQAHEAVLYGLEEWDVSPVLAQDVPPLHLVGGTFSFKGASPPLREKLSKILRVSIYMHLSMLLEQAFLSNCHVKLRYLETTPPTIIAPPSKPPSIERRPTAFDIKPRAKNPFLSGGILSFFSKKTETLFHRTASIVPTVALGNSLDLGRPMPDANHSLRSSEDSMRRRLRRFSFVSDGISLPPKDDFTSDPPYTAAIRRIEAWKDVLSTSVGVSFPPPSLLVNLSKKENDNNPRRPKGYEKMGLTTILGWEGKEMRGKGMIGRLGFIRQQKISLLFSQHVPTAPVPPSDLPLEPSGSSSLRDRPSPKFTNCSQIRWKTYQYYSSNNDSPDQILGEVLESLCSSSETQCDTPNCHFKRKEHQSRWVHGGIQIIAAHSPDDPEIGKNESLQVWESCRICHAKTPRSEMSDGAYLYSFAKFLELLIYSPAICSLSPRLCEHTTPPPRPWTEADTPLPRSRFDIIRHFAFRSAAVSFSLSKVEDIFELQAPRLQILRGNVVDKPFEDIGRPVNSDEEQKRSLRQEIISWWQGLSKHIDKLEEVFSDDFSELHAKSLPRLPSADEAYDELETEDITTPKPTAVGLPPISPNFSKLESRPDDFDGSNSNYARSDSATSDGSSSLPSTSSLEPAQLLSGLRYNFQCIEQSLHLQLVRTPTSSLNDVRRAFLSAARGASKRLAAWQKKHLHKRIHGKDLVGEISIEEPGWWSKGCHTMPGSNIIVREDDWGSIISFTLGSSDFQQELAKISNNRPGSTAQNTPRPPATPTANPQSSFFASTRLFASNAVSAPDPDQEGLVWDEPEPYSAVITRKEHPRDPTSLLSLREVLRNKATAPTIEGIGTPPRFSGIGRIASAGMPPSAWAKPAVELNRQAADGVVNGLPPDAVSSAERILQGMENAGVFTDSPSRPGSSASESTSSLIEAHIHRGKSSIISVGANPTVGPETAGREVGPGGPPDTPPPSTGLSPPGASERDAPQSSPSKLQTPGSNQTDSSFATSLTHGLHNAVRYMLNPSDATPRPTWPTSKNHHGLLSIDALGIDERPHIKYDWTLGKKLKFSCTVYYAKQFDALRKRCGLAVNGDTFVKSLARSSNWAAEGGKSKSNFWKTSDDKFIIKTLVNAWNVADLQVLLELAPSYFRYMDATASKPTVLAKTLGFYTVEIKNLESGTTQVKADLLVMENLFYKQTISKTFDLKGIYGRTVKAGSETRSKTLFDGEWIKGQQQALTLVHPHSKAALKEAIKRDSDFLSQSNIMDYSLLVGIDEEKRQITCGVVDTVGSYTFAKTLEYKAKQGLHGGKEITVVPPGEYQERFVSAIESYFLACPDKWSKSPRDSDTLPSVL